MIIYLRVIPLVNVTTAYNLYADIWLTRSRCSRNLLYILVKHVMCDGGSGGGGRTYTTRNIFVLSG